MAATECKVEGGFAFPKSVVIILRELRTYVGAAAKQEAHVLQPARCQRLIFLAAEVALTIKAVTAMHLPQ
jgi:hypothetical protein